MCLIVFAWQADPKYPFVVAANRDEELTRASGVAEFWPEHPQVLAGRDLAAGGTWMGISKAGRFAALTNYRDPARMKTDAPSRGKLVLDFLSGDDTPAAYLDHIDDYAQRCNGFNLLIGDLNELWWSSNVSDERRKLAPGIYGVSNHLLETPWPKLVEAKQRLAAALPRLPDTHALFDMLRDEHQHADALLPDTGVGLERERWLSAIFIQTPTYSTRSSSLLLRSAQGEVYFAEQTWLAGAQKGGRVDFRFQIQA